MKQRLRKGEKAVITVHKEDVEQQPPSRGLLLPSRTPDYLARRLRDDKPYLNVYDLARFANGNDSGFLTKETLVSSTSTGASPLSGKPDAFSRLLATYRDAVLSYNPDDLASVFLKITGSLSDYNCSIPNFTDYVSGKGLLSPTNATSVSLSAPTNEYFINWLGSRKTTSSPSFSSASVTYTHDAKADIFLTPHFWSWEGLGVLDTPAGFANYPITIYETYDMFKPLPRAQTINIADWDSIWTARASSATWTIAQRDFFREIFLHNPDSQFVQYDSNGVGGSFPVTTFPGTNFPSFYDTVPPGRSWGNTNQNAPRIGMFGGFHSTGFLTAIIVKYASTGRQYYYIWTTTTWTVGNSFDIGANDTLVVI